MRRRQGPGARLKSIGYQIFYRLPARVRRRLVRLVAPTYTVGAVVLVRDQSGRLLLLRQPPGYGWSLPSGLVDRGEAPVQCAVRELAEETGVRVKPEDLSPATPNAVLHPRGRWIDFVFEVQVDSNAHTVQVDGGEVLEAKWHGEHNLPPLTVPTARLLATFGLGPLRSYPEATQR